MIWAKNKKKLDSFFIRKLTFFASVLHKRVNVIFTIEIWHKLNMFFYSRYLELFNACILELVYIFLNVIYFEPIVVLCWSVGRLNLNLLN